MKKNVKTLYLDEVIKNHTRDMTGKIAVITGTTSGTGYVCARELAKRAATVILLNRESERLEDSFRRLKQEVPQGQFVRVICDLQDFDSVRAAAGEINANYDVVDVLCNNAAVMALEDRATKDGYDIQMQTNCLSHFLLTKELFPLLKKSREARIVNHSSNARLGGPLELRYFGKNGGSLGGDGTQEENFNFSGPRWERYHQTKLANCTFAYGLKNKLEQNRITHIKCLLAHPGLAWTSLAATSARTGGMDMNSEIMSQAQSAEDGALGIIRACMDEKAKSGDFYGPVEWTGFPELLPPEDLLTDPENIRITWEGCEAAVGEFKF